MELDSRSLAIFWFLLFLLLLSLDFWGKIWLFLFRSVDALLENCVRLFREVSVICWFVAISYIDANPLLVMIYSMPPFPNHWSQTNKSIINSILIFGHCSIFRTIPISLNSPSILILLAFIWWDRFQSLFKGILFLQLFLNFLLVNFYSLYWFWHQNRHSSIF